MTTGRKIKKIALLAVGDSAWQGGIQYIINILHALNLCSPAGEDKFEVHLFRHPHQTFTGLEKFLRIDLNEHTINEVLKPWTTWNRLIWFLQRKLFQRINPRLENYLLENHFDYVYPATLSDCNGRLNVGSWIADFQYKNFPQGHNLQTTNQAEKNIRFIALNMPKVLFSSQVCQLEGFEMYPELRQKSFVMPFTVFVDEFTMRDTDLNEVRRKYDVQTPFLMVSNLFAVTKNHQVLFDALGILRSNGLTIKLICTGNLINHTDLDFANKVLEMLTANRLHEQVKLLGLVPRADQLALYRMAFALVQPSLHEGWSTCVEEAKALGKALICSDIPVHREQWPMNPNFFNPYDKHELAQLIEKIYHKSSTEDFPKMDQENEALKDYEQQVIGFGRTFLKLASN